MSKHRQRDKVETPLTATSLQGPPFFAPADKNPIHWLLFKTSIQRPRSSVPKVGIVEGFNCMSNTRRSASFDIQTPRSDMPNTWKSVSSPEFKSSGRLINTKMVEVFNSVIIYYQTCFNQNGDYTLTDHSLDSSWHFILKYALAFSFLHQSCQLRQAIYPSGRWRAWTRGNWRWWRRWWARPEKNTPVIIVSI